MRTVKITNYGLPPSVGAAMPSKTEPLTCRPVKHLTFGSLL